MGHMVTIRSEGSGTRWRIKPVFWAGMTAIFFAAVAGLGSVYEYCHLSADLKGTLIRAVAPDAIDGSLTLALHDGTLELHTRRDKEEFIKLELACKAEAAAKLTEEQLGRQMQVAKGQLDTELHSETLMFMTEQAYTLQKKSVPPGLIDDIAQEQILREHRRDERRRSIENAWLQLLQQRLEERVMVQQLRAELGLSQPPPLH